MDLRELVRALNDGDLLAAREWAQEASRRPGEISSLELPRELTKTERAVAAGIVEMLALRCKVTPPAWVESIGPAPEEVWLTRHGRRLPELRERCRRFGPEPLRRRRVFAMPEFLATA